MKKIAYGSLFVSILIPLGVGMVSAALSSEGMSAYANMNKPFLSPPAWLFSVAWTILYILMGVSVYLIHMSEADGTDKMRAYGLFSIQLFLNFMWSIIFFRWDSFIEAFICLVILWGIVIVCAFCFYKISKPAAILLIPYILWLSFAAYLNMGAYILRICAERASMLR